MNKSDPPPYFMCNLPARSGRPRRPGGRQSTEHSLRIVRYFAFSKRRVEKNHDTTCREPMLACVGSSRSAHTSHVRPNDSPTELREIRTRVRCTTPSTAEQWAESSLARQPVPSHARLFRLARSSLTRPLTRGVADTSRHHMLLNCSLLDCSLLLPRASPPPHSRLSLLTAKTA